MTISFKSLVHANFEHAAEKAILEAAAAQLPDGLPDSWVEVLNLHDGWYDTRGIEIYSTATIVERNEALEVEDYAPGHVAIAQDGAGRVTLMRVVGDKSVYAVDVGVMDVAFAEEVAESAQAWLSAATPFRCSTGAPTNRFDVFLVGSPSGGVRGLVEVISAFGVTRPRAEFIKQAREGRALIAEDLTKANFKRLRSRCPLASDGCFELVGIV